MLVESGFESKYYLPGSLLQVRGKTGDPSVHEIVLRPGDSLYVRCSKCAMVNLVAVNNGEGEIRFSLEEANLVLEESCAYCKEKLVWSPENSQVQSPTRRK